MKTPQEKALKKVNYTGTHEHSHNKGGLLGELKGLQHAKHYGIKSGQLKKWRKEESQQKKRGELPF